MSVSVARSGDGLVACMSIAGDTDLIDPADVDLAHRPLRRLSCEILYVDLAGVTFAGAGLMHYLYDVSASLPDGSITLCAPSALIREIIGLSGLGRVAALRDGMPEDWATAPRTTAFPAAEQQQLVVECAVSATPQSAV